MTTMTPHTAATATAAGFVPIPATTKCFSHPVYPGFLFRLVENIDQAATVGGVICTNANGNTSVVSLGLSAVWALSNGSAGAVWRPSAAQRTLDGMGPTRVQTTDELDGSVFPPIYVRTRVNTTHSSRIVITAAVQEQLIVDSRYMGVISKADRGHLYHRPAGARTWSIPVTHPYEASGEFTVYAETMDVGLPLGAGYAYVSWKVVKTEFLAKARDKFLTEFENEAIRNEYATAYDMLAPLEVGSVDDSVALIAHFTGSVFEFTHHLEVSNTVTSNMDPYGTGMPFRNVRPPYQTTYSNVRRWANTDSGGINNTLALGGNMIGTDSFSGAPRVPFMVGASDGSNYTNFLFNNLAPNTDVLIPMQDTFRLDAVPYATIEMATGVVLQAGDIFGLFSPMASPAVPAPTAVLDLKGRVTMDLQGLTDQLHHPALILTETTTPLEGATLISNAWASEAARRELVNSRLPFAKPFTRFIVGFVNKLDDAVSS